jgi:hypothetical protein
MTTKTLKTKEGKTIKVEIVRKVQDKVNYADGYSIVTGREVVDYTSITLIDMAGKVVANGNVISSLSEKIDGKMIAAGAVAKIGNVYLRKDMYDLVSGLLAEVEVETPKSDEQIQIETAAAKAKADYKAWYNSSDQVSARKFEREFSRPDSDY